MCNPWVVPVGPGPCWAHSLASLGLSPQCALLPRDALGLLLKTQLEQHHLPLQPEVRKSPELPGAEQPHTQGTLTVPGD